MRYTPDELLSLLEQRAPALRTAGVLDFDLSATFEDEPLFKLRAHLAPVEPELADAGKKTEEPRLHPLDDPRTYGLQPGDPVPGLAVPPPSDGDDDEP